MFGIPDERLGEVVGAAVSALSVFCSYIVCTLLSPTLLKMIYPIHFTLTPTLSCMSVLYKTETQTAKCESNPNPNVGSCRK